MKLQCNARAIVMTMSVIIGLPWVLVIISMNVSIEGVKPIKN